MDPRVQKLMAELGPPETLTYDRLEEALRRIKFTGFTGIHWLDGVPKQLDLGPPVRLSIVTGLDRTPKAGTG